MITLIQIWLIAIVSAVHNDGDNCYNIRNNGTLQYSLIGTSGDLAWQPVYPLDESAACTLITEFFLLDYDDCLTPFTNTVPSITVTESPTRFSMYGEIITTTDSMIETHDPVKICIKTIYHGYNGNDALTGQYFPSIYYTQVTFRVCEDYIVLDPNKAFYYEKIYEFNSGTYTDTTMKTLGFQNIYDSQYCGLQTYGIYTYDDATSSFVEYTGSDVTFDANLKLSYKTTTKGMNIYYIKALTYGSKTIDYEKIKITVCGLEILSSGTADPLEFYYSYEATYTGLSIPWSTIQNFILFDANSPNSDDGCRQQVEGSSTGSVNVYKNDNLSPWTATGYMDFQLMSGSSTDYEIRIFNNFAWSATQTIYYAEKTLGDVEHYREIKVTVCGSEILSASAEESYFYYAVDTYADLAIEWAEFQNYLTFSNAPDGCRLRGVADHKIYTDAALTTLASTSHVELVSEVADELRLKVYNQNAWNSIMKFYIVETTRGGKTGTKIINIQVCGKETLEADTTLYSGKYYLTSAYTEQVTDWVIINSHFVYSATSMGSDSCRQTTASMNLYQDSSCTTLWTDTSKMVWAQDTPGEFSIKVMRHNSFAPTLAWVGETTLGLKSACKIYEYLVCGFEYVSLVNESEWMSFNETRRFGEKTLDFATYFKSQFQSSSDFCLVEKYELLDENKVVVSDPDIKFENDNSITFGTWIIKTNKTFYLKAMTGNSTNYGYLPINISVILPVLPSYPAPPFFEKGVENIQIYLSNKMLDKEYRTGDLQMLNISLPSIKDYNEDLSTIMMQSPTLGFSKWTNSTDTQALQKLNKLRMQAVSNPYAWLTYNKTIGQFQIQFQRNQVRSLAGAHLIKITLIDEYGGQTEYTIKFIVETEDIPYVAPVYRPPDPPYHEDFIVKAKIYSVDQYGNVLIVFNVNISTAFVNITEMNTTYIDMYVEPYNKWDLDIEDFNMTKLNFTWNVTSYHGRKLWIKINWFSPPTISPKSTYDNLVFHIKDKREFYRSLNEGVNIHNNYTTLRHKVPRQTAHYWIEDLAQSFADMLFSFLLIQAIISLILSGSGAMMLGLVRGLQLITHMPIMEIPFPANAMTFIKKAIEIAQFDLFPFIAKLWNNMFPKAEIDVSLLDLPEENLNIWDQTIDLGYDSHVPHQLLGTLEYLTYFYFLKCAVYCGIKVFNHYKEDKYKAREVRLKNQLFFQDLILLLIEGYFEFMLMVYIYFDRPERLKHPFWSGLSVAYYMTMAGIVLMLAFIYLATRPLETINKDVEFRRKWYALFEDKRTSTKPQVMFYFVFVLRRFIYITIAFGIVGKNYFQIIILCSLNLGVTIYQGYFRPLPALLINWLEAWNEIHIAAAAFNLMLFTEWVHDPEVRYFYGWSFIIIMIHQTLWNLIFVVIQMVNSLKLIAILLYNYFVKHIIPLLERFWQWLKDYCCQEPDEPVIEEPPPPEPELDPNTVLHLNYYEEPVKEMEDPYAKIFGQRQTVDQIAAQKALFEKVLAEEANNQRRRPLDIPQMQEFSFQVNDPLALSTQLQELDLKPIKKNLPQVGEAPDLPTFDQPIEFEAKGPLDDFPKFEANGPVDDFPTYEAQGPFDDLKTYEPRPPEDLQTYEGTGPLDDFKAYGPLDNFNSRGPLDDFPTFEGRGPLDNFNRNPSREFNTFNPPAQDNDWVPPQNMIPVKYSRPITPKDLNQWDKPTPLVNFGDGRPLNIDPSYAPQIVEDPQDLDFDWDGKPLNQEAKQLFEDDFYEPKNPVLNPLQLQQAADFGSTRRIDMDQPEDFNNDDFYKPRDQPQQRTPSRGYPSHDSSPFLSPKQNMPRSILKVSDLDAPRRTNNSHFQDSQYRPTVNFQDELDFARRSDADYPKPPSASSNRLQVPSGSQAPRTFLNTHQDLSFNDNMDEDQFDFHQPLENNYGSRGFQNMSRGVDDFYDEKARRGNMEFDDWDEHN